MSSTLALMTSGKTYLFGSIISSFVASGYTDFLIAGYGFLIITCLDTITSIHAGAVEKDLKFNPLKSYFWREIKSGLIRIWMKKVFLEYAIYIIIAFALEICFLQRQIQLEVVGFNLNLPVFALWTFTAVEVWSVGENIDRAGGTNWIKNFLSHIEEFIPEKFKSFFRKKK